MRQKVTVHRLVTHVVAVACGLAASVLGAPTLRAADVLVVDRLSNSVYRYSETGTLLNTVVTDNANLNQATGLSLSPDLQHLYVFQFQQRTGDPRRLYR